MILKRKIYLVFLLICFVLIKNFSVAETIFSTPYKSISLNDLNEMESNVPGFIKDKSRDPKMYVCHQVYEILLDAYLKQYYKPEEWKAKGKEEYLNSSQASERIVKRTIESYKQMSEAIKSYFERQDKSTPTEYYNKYIKGTDVEKRSIKNIDNWIRLIKSAESQQNPLDWVNKMSNLQTAEDIYNLQPEYYNLNSYKHYIGKKMLDLNKLSSTNFPNVISISNSLLGLAMVDKLKSELTISDEKWKENFDKSLEEKKKYFDQQLANAGIELKNLNLKIPVE